MARRLYEENDIQAIASAIREKNGTENSYKLREMAPAILDISVSSETPMEATLEDYIQGISTSGELNFPNLTSLKLYAFAGLGMTKVSIPNVISLSEGAFCWCDQLEEVDLPENLLEIPHKAFAQCSNFNISSLPDTVESISAQAFSNCGSLTLTTLPTNLKTINSEAFFGSDISLTELPEQLEEISYRAFYNCKNLAITTIPASVKYLGGNAFSGCSNLTSITFEGTPGILDWSVFYECENLLEVNVPWSIDDPINNNGDWCGAPNATINYNYVEEAE